MNGARAISTLPVPNEAAVGRTPFYRKVASELVARIRAGEFASDGALPTEAQLEKEFGVSRITIRLAMKELRATGLVVTQQGRGSFVRPAPMLQDLGAFSTLTAVVTRYGHGRAVSLLAFRRQEAGLKIANQLGIAPADRVLVVERLHQAGGVPFAGTSMHVREDIIGRLDETDVAENTLYEIPQERGLGAIRGERSLSAWPAPVDVATAFGLAPGDPILVSIGGTSVGDGRPLEWSVFSFHPLHYGFRFSFEHGSGTADGHNLDTNL